LASYDEIYWLAGGISKEGGISSLKAFFPKIKKAYLMGQAQEEFATTLDGHVEYQRCNTLKEAFAAASQDALKAGKGVVLLSPACASFDQWSSFEARGDAFCAMAETL
jgi:UDP-N-acetylmuramoylalanine--D-glutamate ligase